MKELNPIAIPLLMYFGLDVTDKHIKKLASPLKSWNRLSDLLTLNEFSVDDLKRMLVMELSGKRRAIVLEKLRSRIATLETQHVQQFINIALSKGQAVHQEGNATGARVRKGAIRG